MEDSNAQKILDKHILAYMIKNEMHAAAGSFAKEADVHLDQDVINSNEKFLREWWCVFWNRYSDRFPTPKHPEAMDGSTSEVPTDGLRRNESQNTGNESVDNLMEPPPLDTLSILQNNSHADRPPSAVPTTAPMPGQNSVDSQQTATPTTTPRPDHTMDSPLPPSAPSTTMHGPELDPSNSGSSPSSSDFLRNLFGIPEGGHP